jgi:hypothetical protein
MIGAPQQICENDESRVSRRSDQDRTTTILNQPTRRRMNARMISEPS